VIPSFSSTQTAAWAAVIFAMVVSSDVAATVGSAHRAQKTAGSHKIYSLAEWLTPPPSRRGSTAGGSRLSSTLQHRDFRMHPDDIYAPTPLGESELHNSATTLTPAQLRLLVRLDGVLTLEQLAAGLPREEVEQHAEVLRVLRDRRLVTVVEIDPFTRTWNASQQALARSAGGPEVDAGVASLQRSGYYVQIARGRPPRAATAPGQLLQAVLIEDDALLARFMQTLLALSGFEVRVAGNRAEVVAEIRRPPRPDLILLDVILPDADGFDILSRVRQHPVLKDVPVVMLTGRATREAVIRGISLGADGYLTKPFEPDSLLRAVRTVLGLPEEEERSPWGPKEK
jgi:CheY-like chemotaxis protein